MKEGWNLDVRCGKSRYDERLTGGTPHIKKLAWTLAAAVLAAPVCFAQGQTEAKDTKPKATAAAPKHYIVAPKDVNWEAPPASLMTGTPSVDSGGTLRYALVEGDPAKAGAPFTLILNCSDGFKVAPHWHPMDENLVRLKGTFAVTSGDKFDLSSAQDIPTGGYGFMPARMHHFGVCKGDTDVLIYGSGLSRSTG
jgi:uncharacterized membrane protein